MASETKSWPSIKIIAKIHKAYNKANSSKAD